MRKILTALIITGIALVACASSDKPAGHTGTAPEYTYNGKYVSGGSFSSTGGAALYAENCQGCHMPGGKGAYTGVGMYPALADNPLLSSPEAPAHIIVNGLRGMPEFGSMLDDKQVAAITNYIITSFGNKSETRLKPEEVKNFRPPAE